MAEIPTEFLDISVSDDGSCISDWTFVEPSPKSRALPRNLAHGFHPRIRAPFQVSLLDNPEASAAVAACSSVPPVLHSAGLPCPERIRRSISSIEFRSYLASVSQTVGLAAPQFSQPLPASLQSSAPVDRSLEFAGDPNVSLVSHKPVADTSKSSALSGAMQRRSQTSTALTRVRISSQSPMDFLD